MHRISKKSLLSTTMTVSKRGQSDYAKAAASVKAVAKQHNLTLTGWLKTHPQDPCRRTKLMNKDGGVFGYGYVSPGGAWWMTRGTAWNAPKLAEGDVTIADTTDTTATVATTPVTPLHIILATAAIANRHEKGLVIA